MSDSQQTLPAAETPEIDPEIEALVDFEPVPRKRDVEGGWTPELQREFIIRLAAVGSPGRACEEMGKNLTGMMKLYRSPLAASFRAAWDSAVELAKRRRAEAQPASPVSPGTRPPSIDHRRKHPTAGPDGPRPGQVLNEHGEWEDEESIRRRCEEAKESISNKLLRARRLYLAEISDSPGKRAAFEILTELPIDWEKATRLEPQPDEPYNPVRMRKPDMLLTAENGWMGELAHGPDKKAELRRAIDEHLAAEGSPPVDWEAESTERSDATNLGEPE